LFAFTTRDDLPELLQWLAVIAAKFCCLPEGKLFLAAADIPPELCHGLHRRYAFGMRVESAEEPEAQKIGHVTS
jgi:hypothetical protein